MKKKKQQPDIIQQKEARLAELVEASVSAVDVVRLTIDELALVNQDIEATMEEITAHKERLTRTYDELDRTHTKNQKIAQNFSKLLCAED